MNYINLTNLTKYEATQGYVNKNVLIAKNSVRM
jgi:hypothetical protein